MAKITINQIDLIRNLIHCLNWDLSINKGNLTRIIFNTFGEYKPFYELDEKQADILVNKLEEEWQKELVVRQKNQEQKDKYLKERKAMYGF